MSGPLPKELYAVALSIAPLHANSVVYDQLRQHIKKQRHCFANKGLSIQSCIFPVVMYGCESWTIKKAERRRIDVGVLGVRWKD